MPTRRNVTIPPNVEKSVYTIRYTTEGAPTDFRYGLSFSWANPRPEPVAAATPATCSEIPEGSTLDARLQPMNVGAGAAVMVRNTTPCAIRITSITLVDCLNVRSDCDTPISVDVVINPGEEKSAYGVRYISGDMSTRVGYLYRWEWAER